MPKSSCKLWLLVGLFWWLSACSGLQTTSATSTPLPPSATPLPPTPTTPPAAAVVNGEPILLADYEAELQRMQQAQQSVGIELATSQTDQEVVLEALIDLELLAQEAQLQGITVSDEAVSQTIDRLTEEAGDSESAGAWMASYGYDLEGLRRSIRRQQLAQATVTRLADQVPAELEQVEARHILVGSRVEAEGLREQLLNDGDFGELALENSLDLSTRVDGGNLGWFPRGVLTQSEVEDMAFELEPGEISPIVESELGYHLIEVLDRQVRPLNANDQRTLRRQAIEAWLSQASQAATIEINVEF